MSYQNYTAFREYLDFLQEKEENNILQKELELKALKEFIKEGKQVGNVYHFTTPANIKSILEVGLVSGREGYISLTRNYRLPEEPGYFNTGEYTIRLTLDGNKISDNLKIEPIKDKNYNDEREEGVIDWNKHKNGLKTVIDKKYIKQIDIVSSRLFPEKSLEFILELCEKYNIKCNILPKWQPVKN